MNKPHASFPISCMQRKGQRKSVPKVNDTKECGTLGHSSWIVWSPENVFLLYEQATWSISLFLHGEKVALHLQLTAKVNDTEVWDPALG